MAFDSELGDQGDASRPNNAGAWIKVNLIRTVVMELIISSITQMRLNNCLISRTWNTVVGLHECGKWVIIWTSFMEGPFLLAGGSRWLFYCL